jgi:hypothetical protein
MHSVYMLMSPAGGTYVGRTKRLTRRMVEHACAARTKPTRTRLSREISAYGFDSFLKYVVVNTECPKQCAFLERFWIGVASVNDRPLNEMIGSQGWASDEVAKKISAAKKGKPAPKRGPVGLDIRRRLSEAHKGYKMPEEQKAKIANAMRGKLRTEEHRRNNGLSQRGKVISAETREKQRLAKLGKKQTAEHAANAARARSTARAAKNLSGELS